MEAMILFMSSTKDIKTVIMMQLRIHDISVQINTLFTLYIIYGSKFVSKFGSSLLKIHI